MTRGADGPGPLRGAAADRAQPLRQLQVGLLLLCVVTASGTLGYWLLGLGPLDALYQTVTTISTVGFRELEEDPDTAFKIFTVVIIMSGVGTALYTLGVMLETLVEGRLTDSFGRRRMQRTIEQLQDHVIVCGHGRVGRAITRHVRGAGHDVVVIDNDPERIDQVEGLCVEGDATDDLVLKDAGIMRARSLVAALNTDADNLFVTLSGRSLRPDLFIVARARVESAEGKLFQGGANRVVNPQNIGGERIAALVLQPSVADFLDVVMHDGSLEFRLEEVPIHDASSMAGKTLRDAHVRDRTGALVLAMRNEKGAFLTNPAPDTVISPGEVLIAIGTKEQLGRLRVAADVATH